MVLHQFSILLAQNCALSLPVAVDTIVAAARFMFIVILSHSTFFIFILVFRRYGIDAIFYGLRAAQLLGSWTAAMRFVAVCRLYCMPCVTIHRAADND